MNDRTSMNSAEGGGAQRPSASDSDFAAALDVAEAAARSGIPQRAEAVLKALLKETTGDGELQSRIAYRLGRLHCDQGLTDSAEQHFKDALEHAQAAGHRDAEAYALNGLAVIARRRGDVGTADELWGRTCALAGAVDNHRLVAMASQNRGVIANTRADHGSAMQQFRKSLHAFERAGDDQGIAWVAINLGKLLTDLRRFAEALETYSLGATHAVRARDLKLEGLAEGNRAATLLDMDLPTAARGPAMRALEIARRQKDIVREAQVLKTLGALNRIQQDFQAARVQLELALSLATGADDALLRAEILEELGCLSLVEGNTPAARSDWDEAESLFRDIGATLDAEDLRTRRTRAAIPG